jgi:hypothetical protein
MLARHSKPWAATAVVFLYLAGSGGALAQEAALYDRLGGLAPIAVVVSEFLDALVPATETDEQLAIVNSTKRDIVVSE